MAGTTNIYKVQYHFETSGKKSTIEYEVYVSAADNKYDTIKTVLSNNSLLHGGGTMVIDQVANLGLGTVYS